MLTLRFNSVLNPLLVFSTHMLYLNLFYSFSITQYFISFVYLKNTFVFILKRVMGTSACVCAYTHGAISLRHTSRTYEQQKRR